MLEPFTESRHSLHQPVDDEEARRLGRRDGGRAGAPEPCAPIDRSQLTEELTRAERPHAVPVNRGRDDAVQHDVEVATDLPLLDKSFTRKGIVLMRRVQDTFGLL